MNIIFEKMKSVYQVKQLNMDTIFMEAVMNVYYDKVVKRAPTYDREVLKSTWEKVNANLVKNVLANVNELPDLPKKNSYITCTYAYEKGDKSGKCCGKVVKNIGQDRCYLHNAEKMEKRKAEAKKKLDEKKAKAINEEVEKKLAEKLAKLTINQTVVEDNDIVSNVEKEKLSSEEIEDSDNEEDEEEEVDDNKEDEEEDDEDKDEEDEE
jgi:hypothetical protein